MSEAIKLAQVAFAAYYRGTAGAPLIMPDSWDMQPAGTRADWVNAVLAVKAYLADVDEPEPELRYALVEQMGHRSTIATIQETTFCGKPMLELTNLKTGAVHLAAPDSLYEITWLTEADARARAKPWTPAAITAGNPNPWGAYGADDYDDDDGRDDGMSQAEKDDYDRESEAILDAQDEADELEREAEADA